MVYIKYLFHGTLKKQLFENVFTPTIFTYFDLFRASNAFVLNELLNLKLLCRLIIII